MVIFNDRIILFIIILYIQQLCVHTRYNCWYIYCEKEEKILQKFLIFLQGILGGLPTSVLCRVFRFFILLKTQFQCNNIDAPSNVERKSLKDSHNFRSFLND